MEAERPWETDVRVGPDAGSVGHPLDSFCRALLDPNVQASAMATSSVLRTFRTPWPENRRAQGSRDRRLGIPCRRWRTRLYVYSSSGHQQWQQCLPGGPLPSFILGVLTVLDNISSPAHVASRTSGRSVTARQLRAASINSKVTLRVRRGVAVTHPISEDISQ